MTERLVVHACTGLCFYSLAYESRLGAQSELLGLYDVVLIDQECVADIDGGDAGRQ
jgi:hypothetical protein